MVVNKKAQSTQYAMAFMIAVCLIIFGLAWAKPVNQLITYGMNTTSSIGGMDCDNSSISDFTKAACITSDISQSYFIGGIMAIAGLVIAARIIFS